MERDQHNRQSIRLKDYDYTAAGGYFVTICVHGHENTLGEVVDGEMVLSACGRIVAEAWVDVAAHFANAHVDASVVMPNHTHAIIMIEDPDADDCRGAVPAPVVACGTGQVAPVNAEAQGEEVRAGEPRPYDGRPTLGQIVGYYKYQTTKHINAHLGTPGAPFWQRNYHEHIIRNEGELTKVREYIDNNPLKWEFDRENPAVLALR